MTNKKLNSLKDKIKEYFGKSKSPTIQSITDEYAHDITKIVNENFVTMKLYRGALKLMHTAEKENAEFKTTIANMKKYYCSDRANCNEVNALKAKLLRRNARILELGEEIKAVKYLNREEVEKVIDKFADNIEVQEGIWKKELLLYDVGELITAICKLALPDAMETIKNEILSTQQHMDVYSKTGEIINGINEILDKE